MLSLRKRLKSFSFAFKGLFDLFQTQPNAKIHLFLLVLVVFFGFFFQVQIWEWCLLILASAMVLAAEAFNTALEYLTDLVSPGYHQLAGKTKDVAAAGVLLTAIGASIIGLLIFIPKFLSFLQFL